MALARMHLTNFLTTIATIPTHNGERADQQHPQHPHLPQPLVSTTPAYSHTAPVILNYDLDIRFKTSPFFHVERAVSSVVECPGKPLVVV